MYFSEFLDHFRAKNIYEFFKKHGDLKEVVIPLKKNKFGRRFGFARFINVQDIRMLAVRFDNSFIDNKNIFANVPIFER